MGSKMDEVMWYIGRGITTGKSGPEISSRNEFPIPYYNIYGCHNALCMLPGDGLISVQWRAQIGPIISRSMHSQLTKPNTCTLSATCYMYNS